MSDRIDPPRLLVRLEAEIAAATSQLEADCKRAERAAYLARVGRSSDARSEVANLQRRYETSPNVNVSSWINLVLGLVEHFSDMHPNARDRILRAHALSTAANLTSLRALSAAWVAHMDYLSTNASSMVIHAVESLRLSTFENHSARSRASLVVAQAYHVAGRLDIALEWYGRVRNHASLDGDEATLSALMHNMAWLRAQALRTGGWMRSESASDEGRALLGAESVSSFDALIGATSLSALLPILRAQIHAARGQFEEALALYETSMSDAVRDGMGRLHADLLADRAWCRVNLGQLADARADAVAAESLIDPAGQFDDRAMAHGRLAQVLDALGDLEGAAVHKGLALAAFEGHEALKIEILRLLHASDETRFSPNS